jgi:tRNA A-37 threonylcarbamoyl transferase component Bud32
MTSYDRVRRLFDALVELPTNQRQAFLQQQQPTVEPAVFQEVQELLAAFDSKTGLFDRKPRALDPQGAIMPERIGAYRIDSRIGAGGMGVVYQAFRDDDAFAKKVAIKVSRFSAPEAEFRRERQILAGLEHRSIARLLDGGTTPDGSLYFVMEFVDGKPLLQYAEANALDIRARVQLFSRICEAVEYAHRNLVVHRDLKPSNILVEADGTPKLLDFGIAQAPHSPSTAAAGMTPRYASPEQIRHQPATTASDVYSLGIILFELLVPGAYPFSEGSPDPKAPGSINPEVDRDLDSITRKALAVEPGNRYAGAAQLREDLDRYLTGQTVLARNGGEWYRIGKLVRRNKLATIALAAAAVVLLASIAAVSREAQIANQQREVAEQRRVEAELATQRAVQAMDEQSRLRVEADRNADEARKQRMSAEGRLGTAQSLASSLLFDAYDSVRLLRGPADARLRIIEKALQGLESLARESPDDLKLRRSLSGAYERAGDLALGVAGEGVSTAPVAIKYYQLALPLARGVCEPCVAATYARISLCQAQLGQTKAASETIGLARLQLKTAREQSREWREAAAAVDDVECSVSQFQGANESQAVCARAAENLVNFGGPLLLIRRGSIFAKLGMNAKNRSDMPAALRFANAATAAYAECLQEEPGRADCERGQANVAGYLALWQSSINGPGAEPAFKDALAAMRRISGQARKATLLDLVQATVSMRYAILLSAKGRTAEAYTAAKESLDLREGRIAASAKPGFVDLNDMADDLLKCPVPELRDNAKALRYAEQAVVLSNRKSPFALSTLADALYANRSPEEAVRVAKEALAILDRQDIPALRQEIQRALERYQKPLKNDS